MADRKPGEEPSLFDLPLRQQPPPGRAEPDPSSAPVETAPEAPEDEPAFWESAPAPSPSAPGLFDDAADPPPRKSVPPARANEPAAEPNWADLAAGQVPPTSLDGPAEGDAEEVLAGEAQRDAVPAPLTQRLAAALLDGGLLLVVTAGAILGSFLLGVRWQGDDLAPLGIFLLVFSFVYSVMPLAFWGRTPGMALARVLSRGADGGPLTFGQTALRWLGGLLTVALVGLPLLLALPALGGRSLADRLSGSHTWLHPS